MAFTSGKTDSIGEISISAYIFFILSGPASAWFWVRMASEGETDFFETPGSTFVFLFAKVSGTRLVIASRVLAFVSIWICASLVMLLLATDAMRRGHTRLASFVLASTFWADLAIVSVLAMGIVAFTVASILGIVVMITPVAIGKYEVAAWIARVSTKVAHSSSSAEYVATSHQFAEPALLP